MKVRTSLLVACIAFAGIAGSIDAQIIKDASSNQASPKVKHLEAILRKSGLRRNYPIVISLPKDDIVQIVTYGDRWRSDKETKLLALQMSRYVLNNVNKVKEVKLRLYDAASTSYWKDIVISKTQIEDGLKPGQQEQTLDSIQVLNNLGLIDGPNLKSRVELYDHILKLKHEGVAVRPFLLQLSQIESLEKKRQNINAQLAALDVSLIAAEPVIAKPFESGMKTNDLVASLQQSFKDACDDESAAQLAVQEEQQARDNLPIPTAHDTDSEARYENDYEALQIKINQDLAALHEAHRYSELSYQRLMQAQGRH